MTAIHQRLPKYSEYDIIKKNDLRRFVVCSQSTDDTRAPSSSAEEDVRTLGLRMKAGMVVRFFDLVRAVKSLVSFSYNPESINNPLPCFSLECVPLFRLRQ